MKSKSVVLNIIINILGALVPLLVAILYIRPMIADLGAEKYGLYSLLTAVFGYFSFLEFGLGRSTVRYLLDKNSAWPHGEVAFHGICLTAIFGVVGGLLVLLLSPVLMYFAGSESLGVQKDFFISALLMGLLIPLMLLESIFRCLMEADHEFILLGVLKVACSLILAVVMITLAHSKVGRMTDYMIAMLGVSLLRTAAHGVAWRLRSGIRLIAVWRRDLLKNLVAFGGWSTVSAVVSPVMINFDRFWISAQFGNANVAYYTTPFDAITKIWLINAALVGVVFPEFLRAGINNRDDAEKASRVVVNTCWMSTSIVLPALLVAIFFAPELMTWWVGAGFAAKSHALLAILAVGVSMNSVVQTIFTAFYAVGRPDIPARFHLLEVPVYGVLLLSLSSWFGLPGVAWAWNLRVLTDVLLLAFALRRLIFPAVEMIKTLLLAFVAMAALYGLATVWLPDIWRWSVGGVLALGASVMALRTAMAAYGRAQSVVDGAA